MHEERSHDDDAAAADEAVRGRDVPSKLVDLRVAQDAFGLGARQDPERPVLCEGIVQMDPERDDASERFGGGVGVQNAVLDRPGPPLRRLEC
jgi:hypothetical protein